MVADLTLSPDERDRMRDGLLGSNRHQLLDFDALKKGGRVFFGDDDALQLYGHSPADLVKHDYRIMGRTSIEGKFDWNCREISAKILDVIERHYPSFRNRTVIDPFLGSGNLLYHVSTTLGAAISIGFENDEQVFACTQHNLSQCGFDALLYARALAQPDADLLPEDQLVVTLIDPPWGNGFTYERGLDLRKTEPPVPETMQHVRSIFKHAADMIFVILTNEYTDQQSVEEIVASYTHLASGCTNRFTDGSNVGYLICGNGF